MGQLRTEDGLFDYINAENFVFKDAANDAVIAFEFDFLKSGDEIDFLDKSCGNCTKVFYENGKIVGTVDITKAGALQKGRNAINKTVTIMLDPGVPYFMGGPKKEKMVNPKKRFIQLMIAGTAFGPADKS